VPIGRHVSTAAAAARGEGAADERLSLSTLPLGGGTQ
jgi:hypothetical protein